MTTGHSYDATVTSIGDGVNYSDSPESAVSNVVTLTPSPLATPSPPVISQATPTSILVNYTVDPLATSTTVSLYDSTAGGSPQNAIDSSGAHTFTGLSPGHSYHATVTSIGDGVNYLNSPQGPTSNVVVLTPPNLATPAAPVLNQTSTSSILITYTPNPLSSSSTILLYDTTSATSTTTSNSSGTHTFTGLTIGHSYHATITSIGDGVNYLNSPQGPTSNVVVLAFVPLAAPSISSATPSITSVNVQFAAVSSASSYIATVLNGATPYSTNPSCTPTSCVIEGLTAGTTYTVQIQAIGDHVTYGDSPTSLPLQFRTAVGGGCGPSFAPIPAPSPSGASPSAFGAPYSCFVGSVSPTTVQLSSANTTSTFVEPLGALPVGTVISVYQVTNIAPLATMIPTGQSYVVAVAVSWQAPDGSSPSATKPITLTVTDSSIAAGDSISRVTSAGLVKVGTATSNGTASLDFNDDPIFIITAFAKNAQSPLSVSVASAVAGKSISLSTSGGSGTGAVAFSVVDGTASGCTISPGSPFLLSASSHGSCIVTAIKAADANFGAISSDGSTMTFKSISQTKLVVTSTKGRVGTALTLTTFGGSGSGSVIFMVRNGTSKSCALSTGKHVTLSAKSPGTCLVTATKHGNRLFGATTSAPKVVVFVRGAVPSPKVTGTTGVAKTGATSTLFITGTGLGTKVHVATATGGVSVQVTSSSATTVALRVTVAKQVVPGHYVLTVSNGGGVTSATYRVTAGGAGINAAALIAELFAGYRQAWAVSPAAGITYAFQHDYPGSATTLNSFLTCNQRVDANQTGETDTPLLSSLRLDPTWRGGSPNTETWSFAGKRPSGTTYIVTDVETTAFSGGSKQNFQKPVHVTVLSGKAFFYFTPAC